MQLLLFKIELNDLKICETFSMFSLFFTFCDVFNKFD